MAQFTDICLSSVTNDIFSSGKDLALTPNTTQSIIQRIRVRLKFFQGEWFLNTAFGVPYHQTIFRKGVTKAQADTIFRAEILDTPGVLGIITFTSTFDRATRVYTLNFSCKAATGETIILEV